MAGQSAPGAQRERGTGWRTKNTRRRLPGRWGDVAPLSRRRSRSRRSRGYDNKPPPRVNGAGITNGQTKLVVGGKSLPCANHAPALPDVKRRIERWSRNPCAPPPWPSFTCSLHAAWAAWLSVAVCPWRDGVWRAQCGRHHGRSADRRCRVPTPGLEQSRPPRAAGLAASGPGVVAGREAIASAIVANGALWATSLPSGRRSPFRDLTQRQAGGWLDPSARRQGGSAAGPRRWGRAVARTGCTRLKAGVLRGRGTRRLTGTSRSTCGRG